MPEEKFIMSPQVDFVFKELMRDEMVRKGFLSAVLNMKDTNNNQYSDILEIHVIELPKLPKTDDRTDLYDWTRFIKAKNRSEIEMSAQNNTYIQKTYEMLEEISADEKMRLAYDARQKALYDENTKLEEAYERGRSERREEDIQTGILVGKKQGIKEGEELGERKTKQAMFEKMKLFGYSEEEIRRILS